MSLGRSGKVLGIENIWLGFRVVRNSKTQSKVCGDLLFFLAEVDGKDIPETVGACVGNTLFQYFGGIVRE